MVVERTEAVDEAALMSALLVQFYGGEAHEAVPREVLVSHAPTDQQELADWLTERRGARVQVRVPQRGDKRQLLAELTGNATRALATQKLRRGGDLTTRSRALAELQEALELDEAPLRIECIDISTLQGTDTVASLVVFEDGLPKTSDYRRYTVSAADDTAAIAEVVRRRLRSLLAAREAAATAARDQTGMEQPVVEQPAGPPRRFAYPPNLLVVDGGQPQVAAAARVMAELGVPDVALCGLAKRLEEVWLPGTDDPVIMARQSEGLYLLQRVRDEAHRFAISAHRAKRSKRMTLSALDGVPGVGEIRRKALLKHFGSVRKLRAASVEEVACVPGIGAATAAAIVAALATSADSPAVNVTTGELLED